MNIWYVSSLGSGAGSGTSADPFRSFAALAAVYAADDVVMIERGSTFTGETLTLLDNLFVGVYGAGALPVIDAEGGLAACVVADNVSGWTVADLALTGATDSGFAVRQGASGRLERVESHGHGAAGLRLEASATGAVTCFRCTFRASPEGVLAEGASSSCTLAACLLFANTNGQARQDGAGSMDIRNSIVATVPAPGTDHWGVLAMNGATVTLSNSLLYDKRTSGSLMVLARVQSSASLTLTNNVFRSATAATVFVQADTGHGAIAADHNHYDRPSDSQFHVSGVMGTFALWQAGSLDANGTADAANQVLGDPEADPSNGMNAEGSNALGGGSNLAGQFTDDFAGKFRPGAGAWDAGPFTTAPQGGGTTYARLFFMPDEDEVLDALLGVPR